ncbi:MAG: hypothetical protein Q9182_006327 [Xanthomendoza sp. 2 TL-2023]
MVSFNEDVFETSKTEASIGQVHSLGPNRRSSWKQESRKSGNESPLSYMGRKLKQAVGPSIGPVDSARHPEYRDEGSRGGFSRHEDDRERYKRERDYARQQYEKLERDNNEQRQVINQFQIQLQKEHDKVQRVTQSAHHMQTEMDNKELFLGPQATDDEVRARFDSVLASIKTWSTNFTSGSVESDVFKEDSLADYQSVAPMCRNTLHLMQVVGTKKRRRLFVRGWAACVMSKLLFRTLGTENQPASQAHDLWLDSSTAQSFLKIEDVIYLADRKEIPYRMFSDWRAFTAGLLSKNIQGTLEGHSQAEISRAVQEVMQLVASWGVLEKAREHEMTLTSIFVEAVRLSQFLRQQRALWCVRFPPRTAAVPEKRLETEQIASLKFDPSCMKDEWSEEEDESANVLHGKPVEIIITPALFKRGNLNGEHFDKEYQAAPAFVMLYRR